MSKNDEEFLELINSKGKKMLSPHIKPEETIAYEGVMIGLREKSIKLTETCAKIVVGRNYFYFIFSHAGMKSLNLDTRNSRHNDLPIKYFKLRELDKKKIKEGYELIEVRSTLFSAMLSFLIFMPVQDVDTKLLKQKKIWLDGKDYIEREKLQAIIRENLVTDYIKPEGARIAHALTFTSPRPSSSSSSFLISPNSSSISISVSNLQTINGRIGNVLLFIDFLGKNFFFTTDRGKKTIPFHVVKKIRLKYVPALEKAKWYVHIETKNEIEAVYFDMEEDSSSLGDIPDFKRSFGNFGDQIAMSLDYEGPTTASSNNSIHGKPKIPQQNKIIPSSMSTSSSNTNAITTLTPKQTSLQAKIKNEAIDSSKTSVFSPPPPPRIVYASKAVTKALIKSRNAPSNRTSNEVVVLQKERKSAFAEVMNSKSPSDRKRTFDEALFKNSPPPSASSTTTRMSTRRRSASQEEKKILFFYPASTGVLDSITIRGVDRARCEWGEYLNDSMIDFYAKMYYLEKINDLSRERIHLLSSFFFSRMDHKLSSRKKLFQFDMTSYSMEALKLKYEAYSRIRTWSKGVDIFLKDFLIVPINKSAHWSLALIRFHRIEGHDMNTTPPKVTIFTLDSLKLHNPRHTSNVIKVFLNHEWFARSRALKEGKEWPLPARQYIKTEQQEEEDSSSSNDDDSDCVIIDDPGHTKEEDDADAFVVVADDEAFGDSNCETVSVPVAAQHDGFNCGVYTLHNIEEFLVNFPTAFLENSDLMKFFHENEFNTKSAREFRKMLLDLIKTLEENYANSLKSNN